MTHTSHRRWDSRMHSQRRLMGTHTSVGKPCARSGSACESEHAQMPPEDQR